MPNDPPIELIIYGDFNCPFSAVASMRAHHLEHIGRAEIDWRAVEHAPGIPREGIEVTGGLRDQLESELEQIRKLLADDEPNPLTLPTRQPNTHLATAAYAATPLSLRADVRTRLFAAHWSNADNLSDHETLVRLGATATDDATAGRWREEWLALPGPIVPVMVLPDGYVSKGLGALARLAKMAKDEPEHAEPERVETDPADLGGEAPCFAHLLEDESP